MRIFFTLLTFLFIFAVGSNCTAQKKELSSSNKRAIRFYDDAELFHQRMEYEKAEEMILKAIKKDENFVEAHALLGYIKIAQKDYEKAIQKFEETLLLDPLFYDALYLDLGKLYLKTEQYEKAIKPLKTYLYEKKPRSPKLKFKAETSLASAEFAAEAIKNPIAFEPENLGPNINSELKEYLAVVSTDQNKIIFTRTIPDQRNPKGYREDFFISYKKNGEWTKAMNMGAPLNSHVNEGGHTLTADGKAMVFTICEVFGDYGKGRKGYGSCDLFVSHLRGNQWTAPKNLGPGINSSFFDSQPAVSTDGSEIYFSSTRKGGYGQSDIYMVKVSEKGLSKPKNLGAFINSPGREEGVFLHPDGQTLYFASNGKAGMGGMDIFRSKRQKDGSWGEAVNLGYPINTYKDEIDFTVDALGKYAYFTSDREGGFGDWDIWRFPLPEHIQPTPVNYLKGVVYDAQSRKKLKADFELIDLATNELVVASSSDEINGEYMVVLPVGKDYALNVSKDGYLFHSENFTLKKPENFEPFEKDVALNPIKEGNTVVLKNVFFDTDSYELKAESETELNKLKDFLIKNPSLIVEIGGHTDNQGSKSHNLTLSQNRAQSVKDFLIQKGIDSTRLSHKGYADEQPIDDNDTEAGRANNRRTEFKIIGG